MIRLFILAILMFFGLRVWSLGRENVEKEDGGATPNMAAAYAHGGECNGKCVPYIRHLTLNEDPTNTAPAKMVYAETKKLDKPGKSEVIDESGKAKPK